ncbi:hypothetical protein I302_103343 [Kwoniella bestiolae CBS 10118]|uniref:F-box domain-containing protein n=1 Tax=Kwoniella bestiolae CBS 10118 TaxID=1296100 RepID=A0A1B9G856_9TREE|nr:hypothetical protein I302_02045 [Kwoniella bestiolae CBS 10118]OCF27206.1 hypothetical protein I302_02045 [Kwoniella bestiolae CBS 10118]
MPDSPFKQLQRTLDEREDLFKDVLGLPLDVRRDLVNKLLWSLPRNDITKLNEQLSGILQRDIIGSLPPELSILILSKLDFEDLSNCGSVCRKWRCIVEEQALWALLCASSLPPIRPAHPTWSDLQTTRSTLSQPKSTHTSDEDEEEEYDDRFGYGYIEPSNTLAVRSDPSGFGLGMKSGLRRNVWERSTGNDGLPIFSYPTTPPSSITGGKDLSPIPSHLPIPSTKPQPNFKHLYIIHRIIHQRMTTPRPIHYNTHVYSPGTERIKMVPKPLTIDMITSVKNGGLPGHSEAIYSLSLINHEMKFDINMNCTACHHPTSGLASHNHQAEISPLTINRSSGPGPLMPGQQIPTQTTVRGREWLLTGSRDRTLRLWYLGVSGPKVLKIFQGGHSGSVLTHCVVKVKISSKSSQHSYALPTKSHGYSPTKGIEGMNLNDLESHPKGRTRVVAVSGGSDGKICLWDIEGHGQGSTVEPEKMIQGHRDSVLCVRANDKYVVSCSKDKTIKLFDIHTLETKLFIGGSAIGLEQDDTLHKGAVNAVGLMEDYIISASGDKTLRIWSIHSGQLLFTVEAHSRGIASIDFSSEPISCEPMLEPGERWKGSLVTGASDSSIKVFHLIEREVSISSNPDVVVHSVEDDKRSGDVSMDLDPSLTLSSTSGTLVPPPDGRSVYLKEYHTMWSTCICPPGLSRPNDTHPQERCRRCGNRGHTELVRTVNIGERVVVSGSYDSKVKVWDRTTAQHLIDLSGHHTGRIFSVTSDKYKIISTGLDCRINIWDFAYGLDTSFVEP